ncbi:MAG: response regulator [Bacteroidota bacterium]
MKSLLFFFAFLLIEGLNGQYNSEVEYRETALSYFQKRHRNFEESIHKNLNGELKYLDSLRNLSERPIKYVERYFYHYGMGYYQFIKNNLEKSKEHFKEASTTAKASDLKRQYIDAATWLGNLAYLSREYELAERQYRGLLKEAIALDYEHGIAAIYYALAKLNQDEGEKMRYFLKIDSIYTAKNSSSAIHANAQESIGQIYLKSISDTAVARLYFEKCLLLSKQNNYLPGIIEARKQIGKIDLEAKEYHKAITSFKSLLDDAKITQDSLQMASSLVLLATCDFALAKNEEAQSKFKEALAIYLGKSDSINMTQTYLMLAKVNLSSGKFDKAEKNLMMAKSIGLSLDSLKLRHDLTQTDFLLAEAKKDFPKALLLKKKEARLYNELRKNRNTKAFLKVERDYKERERKRGIALLESENNLAQQQKTNQRNLFVAGFSILALLLLVMFMLYQNKQKTNTKLRELDMLKSNFFANISHEFRTPLTLIANPIDKKLDDPRISKEERHDFEMAQRNKERLLHLVDQLLDLSKIDAGSMALKVSESQIYTLLCSLAEAFNHLALQHGITYTVDIPKEDYNAWFDHEAISKIVVNLLANAVKYTPEGGAVTMKAGLVGNRELELQFRNSAPDLRSSDLDALFERFYRGATETEGTGIGLALVKELVLLHKGSVKTTKEGDYVQFVITLPVQKENFNKQEIVEKPVPIIIPEVRRTKRLEAITVQTNDELPILLLVEDNQDVQQLLTATFLQHYTIITASDGEDGLRLAVEHIPDLIISDVMMPIKDGIALTKALKEDERTSHIPVILLTAKAGEENELIGIESGADDYITKPFNSKLLTTKVEKLITLRKELQSKYSQELILKPHHISVTSTDEKFLEKVQQVLDGHLIEPDFNVEKFSQLVNMSRMQLLRKIKGLTGRTASEFIKMERLKLAANLLKTADINISEVGYSAGFNDHSYFSKCFRENYGLTPSEYAKNG